VKKKPAMTTCYLTNSGQCQVLNTASEKINRVSNTSRSRGGGKKVGEEYNKREVSAVVNTASVRRTGTRKIRGRGVEGFEDGGKNTDRKKVRSASEGGEV